MVEEKSWRQRGAEENKHPIQRVLALQPSCQEKSSLVETRWDHKRRIERNDTLHYKRLPLRLLNNK